MTPELISNGTNVYQMTRKELQPVEPKRRDLTASQLEWCERHLKGFCWPKVEARKS